MFVDYHGLRLGGISSAFGFKVAPHVVHRAAEVAGKLTTDPKLVNGGQAIFIALVIKNLAGRNISLRFEETSSNLQAQTSGFAIYPFALSLSSPVRSALVGNPVPVAIEMHDNEGQVTCFSRLCLRLLSKSRILHFVTAHMHHDCEVIHFVLIMQVLKSILVHDGFLVEADALKLHNGSWVSCGCVRETGALVTSGIATFTQLTVSTVGRFKLNLTLARGMFSSLSLQTAAFDVDAAAIIATNSSVAGVYSMGSDLGNVTIMVSCSVKLSAGMRWLSILTAACVCQKYSPTSSIKS